MKFSRFLVIFSLIKSYYAVNEIEPAVDTNSHVIDIPTETADQKHFTPEMGSKVDAGVRKSSLALPSIPEKKTVSFEIEDSALPQTNQIARSWLKKMRDARLARESIHSEKLETFPSGDSQLFSDAESTVTSSTDALRFFQSIDIYQYKPLGKMEEFIPREKRGNSLWGHVKNGIKSTYKKVFDVKDWPIFSKYCFSHDLNLLKSYFENQEIVLSSESMFSNNHCAELFGLYCQQKGHFLKKITIDTEAHFSDIKFTQNKKFGYVWAAIYRCKPTEITFVASFKEKHNGFNEMSDFVKWLDDREAYPLARRTLHRAEHMILEFKGSFFGEGASLFKRLFSKLTEENVGKIKLKWKSLTLQSGSSNSAGVLDYNDLVVTKMLANDLDTIIMDRVVFNDEMKGNVDRLPSIRGIKHFTVRSVGRYARTVSLVMLCSEAKFPDLVTLQRYAWEKGGQNKLIHHPLLDTQDLTDKCLKNVPNLETLDLKLRISRKESLNQLLKSLADHKSIKYIDLAIKSDNGFRQEEFTTSFDNLLKFKRLKNLNLQLNFPASILGLGHHGILPLEHTTKIDQEYFVSTIAGVIKNNKELRTLDISTNAAFTSPVKLGLLTRNMRSHKALREVSVAVHGIVVDANGNPLPLIPWQLDNQEHILRDLEQSEVRSVRLYGLGLNEKPFKDLARKTRGRKFQLSFINVGTFDPEDFRRPYDPNEDAENEISDEFQY